MCDCEKNDGLRNRVNGKIYLFIYSFWLNQPTYRLSPFLGFNFFYSCLTSMCERMVMTELSPKPHCRKIFLKFQLQDSVQYHSHLAVYKG